MRRDVRGRRELVDGLLTVRLDLARKDYLDRRVPKVFLNDSKNIGEIGARLLF